MTEAERVTDLVNVGLVAVAIDSRFAVIGATVIGDPVGADIDGCRADDSGVAVVADAQAVIVPL